MKLFMAVQKMAELIEFHEKTGLKLNILISYFYIKGLLNKLTEEYRHIINDLYIDSGAYSAFMAKVYLPVYEYVEFLTWYGHLFEALFNLDDNFDNPEHNLLNLLKIEECLPPGLPRIVPVIHDLEDPFGELQMYVEMGHDFIAVGSNKKVSDDFFYRVKDTFPNIKLHMFGNFNREMLIKHKPYSADAATFIHHARMGSIYYWDPIDNREYEIYLGGRDKAKQPANTYHFNEFHHKIELEQFWWDRFQYYHEDLLAGTAEIPARVVNIYFFKQLENLVNTGTAEIIN